MTALNPKTALNPREGFGSFRRGEDMVVEIFYPGGVPDERFRIGSNADTEQVSVIGFHRYDGLPGCDANLDGRVDELDQEITRNDENRVDDPMHVVIEVNGDIVPVYQQTVTASFDTGNYKVFGEVSTGGVCLGNVQVSLYKATGELVQTVTAKASIDGLARTYEIYDSTIPEATKLYVVAEGS